MKKIFNRPQNFFKSVVLQMIMQEGLPVVRHVKYVKGCLLNLILPIEIIYCVYANFLQSLKDY